MENSGGDNETKSPDYKLTYFDVQWDGEQTRLMFVYRGILFEDVRLPLKLGENDWPIPSQLVDQIPEDVRLKLAGETLPLLEIKGGETIAGVKSTAKFVARKLGFLGQNDSDVAKIDEILEVAYGFSEAFHAIQLASSKEEKEVASNHVVEVVTPRCMHQFNKFIEENSHPNGFMVGDQLSLADLHVFNLVTMPDGRPHTIVTDDCPGLRTLVIKIAQMPQFQKWLETRPKNPF